MNNSTTHYQLILDASGSMSSIRIETLNAVNRQIEAVRELALRNPDQKIAISLTLFNTSAHNLFKGLSPQRTNLLLQRQYKTDGGTALLDAMGLAISELKEKIGPDDDVVMVVITDGEENSSQYFTFQQIADHIRKLKATERWTFTFLGAEIDSWGIANRLQINQEEVRNFKKDEIHLVFEESSARLDSYMTRKRQGKRDGFFKDPN